MFRGVFSDLKIKPTSHLRVSVGKGGVIPPTGGVFSLKGVVPLLSFRIGVKEVFMEHYWSYIAGGLTEGEVYERYSFRSLVLMGYFYTVSGALRDSRCDLGRGVLSGILVSRYNASYYLSEMAKAGQYDASYLNGRCFYTKTGKAWSSATWSKVFGKRTKGKRVRKPHRVAVSLWHKEAHALYRSLVEECRCTSFNAVVVEMQSRGFRSKGGKAITRQTMSYIKDKYPTWDWSFVDREVLCSERVDSYRDLLGGLDLGLFETKESVYAHLGLVRSRELSDLLDDMGWRNMTDSYYEYWEGLFGAVRGLLVSGGWLGWSPLSASVNDLGHRTPTGDRWRGWVLSNRLKREGFNKDAEYKQILVQYIRSWLGSYVGSSPLSDLVLDLNGRNYLVPSGWFALRENARGSERLWTESLLKKGFVCGLY